MRVCTDNWGDLSSTIDFDHPVYKGNYMLRWALTFFIVALIAGVLGFGGLAGEMAGIAKILFLVFLVLFLISFVTGRNRISLE